MTDWKDVIAWVRSQWPQPPAAPQRATSISHVEPIAPQVPREYLGLYTYLEHRYASVVVLTLEQIDALLGFALPARARTERTWWIDAVDIQGHSAAWTVAGRTAAPNLAAGTVTFERAV